MKEEEEIYIWKPSSKKMMDEYPELSRIDEFKDLSDYQLRFCWYYVNPTSPYVVKAKLDRAYTVKARLNDSIKETLLDKGDTLIKSYKEKKWGDKVDNALKRMASTKVRDRYIARKLFNKAYLNMEAIIGMEKDEVRELNMNEKKSYMSMSLDFMKNMDDIIEKREQAYGVKIEKKDSDNKDGGQNISIESIIKNSEE